MAEGLRSTCTVQDTGGQSCNVSIDFGTSIFGNWVDKSNELMALLDAYMVLEDAKVIRRSDNMSHSENKDFKPTGAAPTTPYGTVDQKAIVIMKQQADGKQRRIEIPAPKASMFYRVEGQEGGFRVTAVAGNDIAAKITALGLSVTFVRGWLKSKQ